MSKPAPLHLSPGQRAWNRFKKNRMAVASAWYLALLLVVLVVWPMLLNFAGSDFLKVHGPDALSDAQFKPPTGQHWFGTDMHGRDVFSRTVYGAQISLMVGLFGAAVSLIIGVLWGAVAGYVGGRTDGIMMRTVDVLYSLPSIIFVMVLFATVGERIRNLPMIKNSPTADNRLHVVLVFVGLGAISWLTMARIVRGQVLALRSRAFVEASRTLGASTGRILIRHIIPNILGVVITYVTLTIPAIILYESFLSYLGMGVQPPMASWGTLMAEGVQQINPIRIYWWLLVFPGGVLVTTLLALNFVGDGLRDAWDIKAK